MSPSPALELRSVSKRFGQTVAADALDLVVEQGEFFTLLGPSGSGKSTVLRLIAGLERPDDGLIRIGGHEMRDVPPWRRQLGMVFQQYALFPHMDVEQNVAYGMKLRRMPKERVRERVEELLELVGLAGARKKSVKVLSGGEQQRVALARGLALEPTLMLLDEPLGALDEKIRRGMQVELKAIQRESRTTFIYVTHDQEEALTMSDRVAVMHWGKVLHCDTPEQIFRRPKTRFVAGFFRGCNVLEAELLSVEPSELHVRLAAIDLTLPHPEGPSPRAPSVPVALRAEDIHVGDAAAGAEVRIEATVEEVVYRGTNVDYLLRDLSGQPLVATATRRDPGIVPQTRTTLGFALASLVPLSEDDAALGRADATPRL